MRTKLLFVGIAGFVVAALGAASLTAAASTPVPEPTLHFDVQFHSNVFGMSGFGFSLGHTFVSHDTLLPDGNAVDHNGGLFTITDLAGEAACTLTWDLGDGVLRNRVARIPSPRTVFAAVGDAGSSGGAREAGEFVESSDQMGSLDVHLTG